MIHTSPFPDLDIPKCNILHYLFPDGEPEYDEPVWHDAADPKKSLSPKQMLQWIKRITIGLQKLGVQKGDVCMIHSPNHILVPAAYLGIIGGTMIFSAANPTYTVDEIVHQLKNTGAKCLLAHPSLLERDVEAAEKAGLAKDRVFMFSEEECKPQHGVKDFRKMIGSVAETEGFEFPELSPGESQKTVATINYSSGTTGMPKGVMISHHSLISNVEQTMAVRWPEVNHQKGEKPLYAILMCTKTHVPIYIMRQFQYAEFLQAVEKFRITHLQVAPPVLVMMSKRPETKEHDLSSIQGILCGAAPLSKELQNDIAKRFAEVKSGWGMTEVTCGSILQNEASDNGTVGRLIPNNKLKVIDDDGNELGTDVPGELCIQAPNVMLGYWENEAATRESLTNDGWLKTGDVVVVNKEGYVWIVDRKKELIKVNALQVAPAELEGKLLEHDGIADAAAVGIQLHGEEWPRAYVVPTEDAKGKLTTKQVQDWFKGQVSKHKALIGGVVFVDEIPKLQSGKIQRKVLREWSKRDAPEMEKGFDRAKL